MAEGTDLMYRYNTHGTCSRQIEIEMDGDTVRSVRFIGGCTGNTQGLSRLVEGMQADEVIRRLKGIQCRAGTSCPDQLARALERIRTQA